MPVWLTALVPRVDVRLAASEAEREAEKADVEREPGFRDRQGG